MAEIRITELDFNTIKTNLKNYLRAQSQFSDYDFEGAGLTVLLETLAYNTHYNAVLGHLVANEMFLDSAIKRSSVVSHAKTLGYTPRSAMCSTARVNITVVPTGVAPASLYLGTDVAFTGRAGDSTFTFYPKEGYTVDFDTALDAFYFENVELMEGTRITQTFTVTGDTTSGPFTLLNNNVDTRTIDVTVQATGDAITSTRFIKSNSIIDVSDTSKVFWVEEGPQGKHVLRFGDDTIGQALAVGNIVTVSYLVCVGDATANGARSFTLSGTIGGYDNVSFELEQASSGGAAPEDIDSIRFNAPRSHATQNRVVTVQDYKSVIRAHYPNVKGISVWGGEQNMPPIYGKVFISIDPRDGQVVTDTDKDYIIRTVLRPRAMMGIQHEFVDPDYMYICVEADLQYNANLTRLNSSAIETQVRTAIESFFENEVSTLDNTFHYSRFLKHIDETNAAIISSQVALRLEKRIVPTQNTISYLSTSFNTKIEAGSIYSSVFKVEMDGVERTGYIEDIEGTLRFVENKTGVILSSNIGTVNYTSGSVVVPSIYITGFVAAMQDIRFYANPEELNYNISPTVVSTTPTSLEAVYPYPAQNIIISLDTNPAVYEAGTPLGLKVRATATIVN